MNCPKCGTPCDNGEHHCSACGAQINTTGASSAQATIKKASGKLDSLVQNPGKVLKTLAKILLVVGIIASIIVAITNFSNATDASSYGSGPREWRQAHDAAASAYTQTGFLTLVLGPIGSIVSFILLYSFGSLVENVKEINEKLSK